MASLQHCLVLVLRPKPLSLNLGPVGQGMAPDTQLTACTTNPSLRAIEYTLDAAVRLGELNPAWTGKLSIVFDLAGMSRQVATSPIT